MIRFRLAWLAAIAVLSVGGASLAAVHRSGSTCSPPTEGERRAASGADDDEIVLSFSSGGLVQGPELVVYGDGTTVVDPHDRYDQPTTRVLRSTDEWVAQGIACLRDGGLERMLERNAPARQHVSDAGGFVLHRRSATGTTISVSATGYQSFARGDEPPGENLDRLDHAVAIEQRMSALIDDVAGRGEDLRVEGGRLLITNVTLASAYGTWVGNRWPDATPGGVPDVITRTPIGTYAPPITLVMEPEPMRTIASQVSRWPGATAVRLPDERVVTLSWRPVL